jgi:tellurite resistance protein
MIAEALNWGREEFSEAEKYREMKEKFDQATSDEDVAKRMAEAKKAMADESMDLSEMAAVTAVQRTEVDPRKQALYDAVYVVAAADKSISADERAKLSIGLLGMLGESFDETAINQGLETARVLYDEKGLKGTTADIASRITAEGDRNALLTIASTVAWLGGGVGTKEGLALQALAAAFSIPINELHKIMAAAARIAKLA